MASDLGNKPESDFIIRLAGHGIKPWAVPLRVLGRVLAAVQRLVDQRDDLADTDESEEQLERLQVDEENRTLKLLKVTAQSAGYAVSSTNRQTTLSILRDTGRGIEKPSLTNWQPSAISSIDDLSQIAKQLGCVIEFREITKGKSHGDVIAIIRPETSAEIRSRAFVHGHTSVVGKLERVGGATAMRCGIHVQDRPRMLFCNVANTDLVRELGKHIYADVVLTGEAVWYRFNNQLKSLTVSAFSPVKTESFSEIAKQINLAGGSAWDTIPDPTAFIREMRS